MNRKAVFAISFIIISIAIAVILFRKKIFATASSLWTMVIDKTNHSLQLFKQGELIKEYPVATGLNIGDKKAEGDMKTPEGEFTITEIENVAQKTHKFANTGLSKIPHAYGDYFLRLSTKSNETKSGKKWKGIGIHGTTNKNVFTAKSSAYKGKAITGPLTIGKNISEGCIRLKNEDLLDMLKTILGSSKIDENKIIGIKVKING